MANDTANLDQLLQFLSEDNTEEGVSFTPTGREFLATKQDIEKAAFQSARLKPAAPIAETQETSQGNSFIDNLNIQMWRLQKASGDPSIYAQELANATAMVAAKKADFFKEAQAQAYAKYGVADLEKQVSLLKRREQSTPDYVLRYGIVDSDEVVNAKKNLMSAKAMADGTVPELLKGNAAFNSLEAYSKTIIETNDRNQQREMDKLGDIERKAVEILSGYTPEQRETLSRLTGFSEPRQQFQFLKGNQKHLEDIQNAVTADPKDLPTLALVGNKFAGQLTIENEKRIYGIEAGSRVKALATIAADPIASASAFKEMKDSGFFGTATKEWEKKMSVATAGLAGAKEQQKASAFMRLEVAKAYGQFLADKEFKGDLLGLQNRSQVPAPIWLKDAAGDIKQGMGAGKVSLEQAITLANSAPDLAAKRQRHEELLSYYGSAVSTQNNSELFKVNPFSVEMLKAKLTLGASQAEARKKFGRTDSTFGWR